jgi:sarcosine oxidase delta subunit
MGNRKGLPQYECEERLTRLSCNEEITERKLLCPRSAERGASLKEWIHCEAMKRFHFTAQDSVYKTIMEFVDILLEPPLKHVT